MELHEYPRPHNDTGLALAWPAHEPLPVAEALHGFWLTQLRSLGIKWLQMHVDWDALSQVLPLVEILVDAQIMPLLLLPGRSPDERFSADQLRAINDLVQAGTHYLALPRPSAPPNASGSEEARWVQSLVGATIANAREILGRGGLPGLPMQRPTDRFLLVRHLLEQRQTGLLTAGAWQAFLAPGGNRPPHFPRDPAALAGSPITRHFFDALAKETWSGDAWQGRSLEAINRLRAARRNQVAPDAARWGWHNRLDQEIQKALGYPLPLMALDSGWRVGAATDPRYPAVTPNLHMAYTLAATRGIMGSGRRVPAAPPAYFCCVLGNLVGRSGWYDLTQRYPTLPVVIGLQAEPKRARTHRRDRPQRARIQSAATESSERTHAVPQARNAQPSASTLQGEVRGGAQALVRLVEAGGAGYSTLAGTNGRYRFVHLPQGRYTVWVEKPPGSRREDIHLDGRNTEMVDLRRDGWGYQLSDAIESARPGIILQCRVAASIVTVDAHALALRVGRATGGDGGRVITMARRADGSAGCEIGPLASGDYRLELLGLEDASGEPTSLETTLSLREAGVRQLIFIYSTPSSTMWNRSSQVSGTLGQQQMQQLLRSAEGSRPLPPDAIAGPHMLLVTTGGREHRTEIDRDGFFLFQGLPPDRYRLSLVDGDTERQIERETVVRSQIALDGHNQVRIDLSDRPQAPAGVGTWGALFGMAPTLSGQTLYLRGESNRRTTAMKLVRGDAPVAIPVDDAGYFGLERIIPDSYTLSGPALWLPGLEVRPGAELVVTLPPAEQGWEPLLPIVSYRPL